MLRFWGLENLYDAAAANCGATTLGVASQSMITVLRASGWLSKQVGSSIVATRASVWPPLFYRIALMRDYLGRSRAHTHTVYCAHCKSAHSALLIVVCDRQPTSCVSPEFESRETPMVVRPTNQLVDETMASNDEPARVGEEAAGLRGTRSLGLAKAAVDEVMRN